MKNSIDDLGGDSEWQAWAQENHAISAGTSWIEFVVQGRSAAQVKLLDMRVRVVDRQPPVMGTSYGLACGGDGVYRWVAADLDAPKQKLSSDFQGSFDPPDDLPQHRGPVTFPYNVAINDSEVFELFAHTKACACAWIVELDWASEGRTGTTVIDDHGKPFVTTSDRDVAQHCIKNQFQPLHPQSDCKPGPL